MLEIQGAFISTRQRTTATATSGLVPGYCQPYALGCFIAKNTRFCYNCQGNWRIAPKPNLDSSILYSQQTFPLSTLAVQHFSDTGIQSEMQLPDNFRSAGR